MNKLHVKTGDTVIVLSGKDKGKKGKVELEYYSEDDLDALLRLLQYSQDGGDFS